MKSRGRPRKNIDAQPTDWGRRIREARERKKMSQDKLGECIGGKSQSSVGEYESGRSEPDLATFELIAKALEVSAAWLAFGHPDDSKPADRATIEAHKDDRLFSWTFHQAARLLAEEGLEGDLAYLVTYARKLMGAAKGAADDTEAKELIRATIEIERAEIRRGLDQIRKNRI